CAAQRQGVVPLRVGIDARLADYAPGGIARYTFQLARALRELGGADYLLLRAARPKLTAEDVPPMRSRRLWTPPHHPLEQPGLPLELLGFGLDVLHSPDFIPPRRRRWHSVVTVHDLAFLRYPDTMTVESRRYYG